MDSRLVEQGCRERARLAELEARGPRPADDDVVPVMLSVRRLADALLGATLVGFRTYGYLDEVREVFEELTRPTP